MGLPIVYAVRTHTPGHMIPHATHGFEGSGLPENLPYFLTLSGYMLIFFVEKVAFDAHHIMDGGGGGDGHGHDHGSVAAAGAAGASEVAAAGPPSGRSAIILLLALGVHALMETMALGLSSNKLSAGLLAMSIGLHQVRLFWYLTLYFCFAGIRETVASSYLFVFDVPPPRAR